MKYKVEVNYVVHHVHSSGAIKFPPQAKSKICEVEAADVAEAIQKAQEETVLDRMAITSFRILPP